MIRQFNQQAGGKEMAEVLIDLEEDDLLRLHVIELLRHVES